MRHLVSGKTLSRDGEHRKAMRRNLAAALFIHGRIKTTEAKAKFVKPFVERIITIARKGDLNARRQVISLLQDRFIVDAEETDVKRNKSFEVVKGPRLISKIIDEVAPKYADCPGGYTRIIRIAKPRLGDNGTVVYLELVDPSETKQTKRSRTGGNRKKKARMREDFLKSVLKPKKKAAKKEDAVEAEAEQAEDAAAEESKADTEETSEEKSAE